MSNYASQVISIAEAEVGYLEKASSSNLDSKTANPGDKNYTKYARDLDAITDFYNTAKQSVAWCCVFVHWCFVQAYGVDTAKELTHQPSKSLGAGVGYCMDYYKNYNQFHVSNPKVGDQIFFGDSDSQTHTGLVYKVDSQKVYTIEGNTPDPTGSNAYNGVYKNEYALSDTSILGYGRPLYDESVIPSVGGTTEYFGLYKPTLDSIADITELNGNWDKIDAALHGMITFGTTDLIEGTSPLATGKLYVVYE